MPTPKINARRKPTLHFVFAAHAGKRTANVLRKVLVRTRRNRQRPLFIGTELSGIKAAKKRELEKQRVGGFDEEDRNQINKLAAEYRLPIRLVEAARPKQHKKISKTKRHSEKFPSHSLSAKNSMIYRMQFGTATSYTTDSFYYELNKNLARHDEVLRNLRKETKSMAGNETGIVVYGEYHRGLDHFIASKLGLKTTRTSERVPYRAIRYEPVFDIC